MKNPIEVIKRNLFFSVFLCITVLFMIFSIIWVYHVKVLNAPKVYSDGFGYYVYLPATFIYHDFSFGFVEGWEHSLKLMAVEGGMVDKYPIGIAIMESPFFLAAHLVSVVKDAVTGSVTATGYTNIYQYAVLFGGALYWAAGTILLYRLLERYLHVSKRTACLTCLVMTFGTNLFHYASYDACFSHIYSYALFNLFLYYLCWYEDIAEKKEPPIWQTCVFGLLAGLIFMCRNTNLLFVLTYLFYGVKGWRTLKERIRTVLHIRRAVPIVLTGCITIMPQLLYWHAATGHWFVYSYGKNEPFYWLNPQILNFLFSVRKGLFFWSPVFLVALAGVVCAYKQRDKLYIGLVVFLIAIVYLSSAWWSWWYGGSYGQRVAVDFTCVFAIFTAYLFDMAEKKRKKRKNDKAGIRTYLPEIILYSYCGGCILWNLVCMMAYWYDVIPDDEATWQSVRNIFAWLGI